MDDAESVHGDNVGDVNDFHDVDWDQMGSTGEIQLPSLVGGVAFHVTSTMLQLLQLKGLFGGQAIRIPISIFEIS